MTGDETHAASLDPEPAFCAFARVVADGRVEGAAEVDREAEEAVGVAPAVALDVADRDGRAVVVPLWWADEVAEAVADLAGEDVEAERPGDEDDERAGAAVDAAAGGREALPVGRLEAEVGDGAASAERAAINAGAKASTVAPASAPERHPRRREALVTIQARTVGVWAVTGPRKDYSR